jgi:hypothetical protein
MIQTSDKTNAAGKSVRQMEDDEVRDRLRRIAGYNRTFAGTHHMVTEGEIYGYMTEWHVDPAVYGISAGPAPEWTPPGKGEQRQRVAWLPDGEKAVQEKGEQDDI